MPTSPRRQTVFREAIERFLKERLSLRLNGIDPGDTSQIELLHNQFEYVSWLSETSSLGRQIQLVTHPLRATIPDAKISKTTSLHRHPSKLPFHKEVGSHSLPADFRDDIAGNAAVSADKRSDLLAFLRLECLDEPMSEWFVKMDADLLQALGDNSRITSKWAEGFQTFLRRPEPIASHTRAKQLYWLTGDDPCDDGQYQLLAPLYASSLAHAVFQTINEDRFGEAGKAARQARRDRRDHETGCREYPNLAVQKLGGTKPQNISQLNSERGGNNYLLASLPPRGKTQAVQAPRRMDSVFPWFGRRDDVRKAVHELRAFLLSNPPKNVDTRNRVDALTDTLIDELVVFAHPLQATLPPGWTREPDCRLAEAEKLWLDPGRAAAAKEDDTEFVAAWQWMDWPAEIGKRFGNWLNAQLGQQLPLGDIEGRHWRDELLRNTGWAGTLHQHRRQADAPTYIPVRGAP